MVRNPPDRGYLTTPKQTCQAQNVDFDRVHTSALKNDGGLQVIMKSDTRDTLPKATRLFAQIPLIFFELGLHKRLSKVDWLVMGSMLYGTTRTKREDPNNGKCCVMVSRILRENKGTRLRWPTQVERSRERLSVKLGLFKHAGFRKVALADRVVSVRVYRQATGLEIWEHARKNGLVPEGWAEEQALREHNRKERREAEEAERKARGCGRSGGGQPGEAPGATEAPGSNINAGAEEFIDTLK